MKIISQLFAPGLEYIKWKGDFYILIDMRCKQDGINLSIDNRQVGEREKIVMGLDILLSRVPIYDPFQLAKM